MKKIKALLLRYKSVLLYLIFGVGTTLVNILSYYLCAHPLGMATMVSTVIAWVLAVLFAYITNRRWVFGSKATTAREIFYEILRFFGCRLATGIIDWLCMFVFVDLLSMNDVLIKAGANVLVIVLNYIASKVIIYKK